MPNPFHPDIAVLQRIRPMCEADLARVAELHKAAMGNSLWAQLGHRFLMEIYRALLQHAEFLGFVYEEQGEIEGFIAGSLDTAAMMRGIALKRLHRLSLAALFGLRNPKILRRLLETPFYFRNSSAPNPSTHVTAESLFCSFTPKTRGKRISGHINKVLFDTLLFEGHSQVKITTETDNEEANRQLQSWGFQAHGKFQFYGKEMVLYILDLNESDRVMALDWRKPYAVQNFQSNLPDSV